MGSLLCLLLLCPAAAFAQEEPVDTSDPSGDDAPSLMRPGSDSPEASHARKYDGPRHRAQAFLIPMDEGARHPTTRVATAVETVLLHTPLYEVVDLGHALSVESTVEQAQKADEGRRLVAGGNASAAAKGWPEAAAKYQRALQDFDLGLPAVSAHEYATRRGFLDVDTRPAGARVQVDGEPKGPSPVHAELPAGRHLLRVERAGFYPTAELIDVAPRKGARQSITLSATPTAASLNQIIAGASDEVGRGTAGKNVSALAQEFSLERVLVGSVRSQEESRVSVVLALVDAVKHRIIAAKTLTLSADGTDADQIELETQAAARKLVAADDAGAEMAEAAATSAPAADTRGAPGPARKPVMPGAMLPAAATADEPGLVARERKVVIPAAALSKAESKAAADPPAPASKEAVKKQEERKKSKGLQGKTGTEGWGDD